MAGAAGAALLGHALEQGWIERLHDSRVLTVTPAGVAGLTTAFSVEAAP